MAVVVEIVDFSGCVTTVYPVYLSTTSADTSCESVNLPYQWNCVSMDQSYQRVLRQHRVVLMRELPAVAVLLDTLQLKHHFSTYEKDQILSLSLPAEKAAKFLDALEFKSYDVYVKFLAVLRELRPDLALRLDGGQREADASSTASSPVSNGSPPCKCWVVLQCVCV